MAPCPAGGAAAAPIPLCHAGPEEAGLGGWGGAAPSSALPPPPSPQHRVTEGGAGVRPGPPSRGLPTAPRPPPPPQAQGPARGLPASAHAGFGPVPALWGWGCCERAPPLSRGGSWPLGMAPLPGLGSAFRLPRAAVLVPHVLGSEGGVKNSTERHFPNPGAPAGSYQGVPRIR